MCPACLLLISVNCLRQLVSLLPPLPACAPAPLTACIADLLPKRASHTDVTAYCLPNLRFNAAQVAFGDTRYALPWNTPGIYVVMW